MKLIGIFLICAIDSFSQTAASYKIVGFIRHMPDQDVYLDYYDQGKKYRYTTTSHDGAFGFTGTVSEPVFANIHHETGSGEIELFLDNTVWKVAGDYSDYNGATVIGSIIDVQWKKYFAEDQRLISIFSKDQMNRADLLETRIELLKSYVKKYCNSHAGALIPNFCTIEKSLTHDDWIEIYELLSAEMKNTYYGRKIRAKVER